MFIPDERGIVGDWLVKLVVGFAVVAVVGYDAGSIAVNYFTLDSGADDVAERVSTTVAAGSPGEFTPDEIVQMALVEVKAEDGGVEGAKVVRKGTTIDESGIVRVRLRRTADTLVVKRISAIKRWARAVGDGQAGT